MQNRSSRRTYRVRGSAPAWLAAAALLVPASASAQQTLANRLIPILNGAICGSVSDPTLSTASCIGGLPAAEQAEVAIQFSGNTAAAAGSNASQTTIAQVDSQSERLAEVRGAPVSGDGESRAGGFLNGFGGWGDTGLRGEEPGFDYHGGGFTAGFDYRLTDNSVVGAGFGWNRQTNEFDTNAAVTAGTIGGGELEADSYVTSLYASWFDGPLYVDGMFSYTFVDYEMERNVVAPSVGISQAATSETDAHQVGLSLGGGYEVQVEGFNVGPTAQMNYLYTKIDRYREGGSNFALAYQDQTVHSLITSVGGEVSYPVSTGFGVLTPHVRATWEHEFQDDPRSINSVFVLDDSATNNPITTITESPDRNYARVGVGVAAQFKDGIAAFVDYETVLGLRRVDAHKVTFGGRVEF